MALSKIAIFVFFMVASVRASRTVVHTVGNEKGWTKTGDNFYGNWAAGEGFSIGDVLVFKYDPNEHNVLEVWGSDYDTCSISSPIATYTSGNDIINITEPGTYCYICGVPGHCEAGMKFQFAVAPDDSPPDSPPDCPPDSPPAPPPPPSLGGQNPPAPRSPSGGSALLTLSSNWLLAAMLGLYAAAAF